MQNFFEKYAPWLQESYLGNTLEDYFMALLIFLGFLLAIKLFKNRLLKALERWSAKTTNDLDNEFLKILEKIPGLLYFFAALFFALKFIQINALAYKIVHVILVILIIYWSAKVASQMIEYALFKMAQNKGATKREKTTTYFALSLIAKIVLWSVGFLLILSNLGVNITALGASLGVGGIAVALAIQNVLSDIFSSFTIYLDKPFEVGDYIIVGEHEGTVKKIGLKSTRLEALQGEEIVISNKELTSVRIQNFKRMKKRRIAFHIGVTYDTKATKLAKIPKIIETLMEKIELIEFNRTHFQAFSDSSLDFEIVYYIQSAAYADYMDKQHQINLEILKAFEKEKIEMAFPTRTIYMKK